MGDLDFLKKEVRKNATVAEYLDGFSVKLAQEILNIRLKKGLSQTQLASTFYKILKQYELKKESI